MAYTKSPQVSTYQTKTVSIANELNSRDGSSTKDIDFLNCFFEVVQSKLTGEKEIQVYKRGGTSNFITATNSNIRGLFYWEDQDKILVAIDDDVVIYNSNTGAVVTTLNNIFTTNAGTVGFTEFLYDDNTTKVVATDGITLGTVDTSNAWVASADADLPNPHIPMPVFLDGYLFVVKGNSADIYNSDLNDPLAWTPGDFISCEMFPDTVTALVKMNNYLLAFGSGSVEYFWDAGNTTGSPLQRNDTPVKLVGYLGGLAQQSNKVYFVGSTAAATPEVYEIEDFKIKPISNESVKRYLENLGTTSFVGNVVSTMGHNFYVLAAGSLTHVYDLESGHWFRWAYQQTTTFPLSLAISVKTNSTYSSLLVLTGRSTILKFNNSIYQDDGVSFTMRFVTDNNYYDTYNNKFMSRLTLLTDKVNSNVSISWSDDDYQTYTTPIVISLNQELPVVQRLGRFRRRAFKLEHTANTPLRIQRMDVDINLGQA